MSEKVNFNPNSERSDEFMGDWVDNNIAEQEEVDNKGQELTAAEREGIQRQILDSLKENITPRLEGLKKLGLKSREGGDGVIERSFDLRAGDEFFVRIFEQPTLDRSFKINIYVKPELANELGPIIEGELSRIQSELAISIEYSILPHETDDFNPLNI